VKNQKKLGTILLDDIPHTLETGKQIKRMKYIILDKGAQPNAKRLNTYEYNICQIETAGSV
jgi:hypothetical protein